MGLELEGLMGLFALAMPVAALLTVMALAVRRIRQRRKAMAPLTGRYGEPVAASAPPKAGNRAPEPTVAPTVEPPREAEQPAAVSAESLEKQIAQAEAAGAEKELAGLYLAFARDRAATERPQEAAEFLRKAIRLSVRLGQKDMHARARLDLGDLAREQGDLTTACEHWQMARQLFHETKSTAQFATADKRMRQNGCPTDWVLNDF